ASISSLSLHDALPIFSHGPGRGCAASGNGPQAASSLNMTICTHGYTVMRERKRSRIASMLDPTAEIGIWMPAMAKGVMAASVACLQSVRHRPVLLVTLDRTVCVRGG